jgi:probable phosphoglycerate mutase
MTDAGSVPATCTTRLLLVRHGESMVTVNRIVGGAASCTGLSPLGRRQAERLRDRFAAGHEPAVARIVSSTLPRAIETARIVAEALGLPVDTERELEEQRPGDADGLPWDAVEDTFGPYHGDRYPHRRLAPGAETPAEFHQRVGAALHRLVEDNLGTTVLVSCHGGVIDMAFRGVLGLPMQSGYDLWTTNTSITEFGATHPVGVHPHRWRLVRYNDASHLAGLPRASAAPPI